MKESLAARQAALLRQNAELDQKVEAIEQRRQQQMLGAAGKATSQPLSRGGIENSLQQDEKAIGGENDDAMSSPRDRRRVSIDMSDFSMDSPVRKEQEEPEKLVSDDETSPRRRPLERKKSSGNVLPSETARKQLLRRRKSEQMGRDTMEAPPSPEAKQTESIEGDGLGLEATVRYQKARLRVLQDELEANQSEMKELHTVQGQLRAQIEELAAENAALKKKNQQTQQLLDKQQELSAAQESKQKILETQLSAANAKVDEVQKAEKQASQQFRSKEVRLNRALEELEKVKAQLQEERRTHGEQTVAKAEYEQVVKDNKRLEKQKNDLLLAFKKQMKLIDLLKRQRIHMEAAKMLSFTEEEFSKTLELG